MSAVLDTRPVRAAIEAARPLEVVASWRVLPGALMVLGWSPEPLPATGAAQVERVPGSRGVFRALCWAGSRAGDGHAFLAAIRLPDRADPADGATIQLRGAEGGVLLLALPQAADADAGFGQHVAQLARAAAATVARFMLDTLRPSEGRSVPHVATMLRAYLSQAAQPDGCVEIMTAVPDGCVLLQGWGAPLRGSVQVVLAGAELPCFEAQAGEFARNDVALPARGVMLALPPAAAGFLPGLDHVFVLSDAGVHGRTLVEHRLLEGAASLGHLGHMLPALRGPAPLLASLRDALRPRFDGRNTLAGHPQPVRAAVDTALAAADAGTYVSGWVFDPQRRLAALHLCGTAGFCERLDTGWTRVVRPDVSDAFRNEAGFGTPPDDEAGFAVATGAAPAEREQLYLQFTFVDGDRAFMPIAVTNPGEAAVRVRLLAGVDLFKPSGLPILERHVAPFLARLRPAAGAAPRVLLRGPLARAHAVVVPLAAPVLPRALLSDFLHAPAAADEQIVLVCGPEWTQAGLDGLRALVRFYGLPATVLAGALTATATVALRAAAAVTTAETLLLAGPGVSGSAPGWRAALRAAADATGTAAFACPTMLYEDWSIRYAGSPSLRFSDTAPYAEAHAPMAGLPAALTADRALQSAAVGNLDCCLVRRSALVALDGARALATAAGLELDFFGRLAASGLAGVWVPSVRVFAPEAADAAPTRAAALVDGLILRTTWRRDEEAS